MSESNPGRLGEKPRFAVPPLDAHIVLLISILIQLQSKPTSQIFGVTGIEPATSKSQCHCNKQMTSEASFRAFSLKALSTTDSRQCKPSFKSLIET